VSSAVDANNRAVASDDQVDLSWFPWRKGIVAGGAILSLSALGYLVVYAIHFHPKPSDVGGQLCSSFGLGQWQSW